MKKQAFAELLLNDLRELKFPLKYTFFMPENVLERHKETLKGPYLVQINDMEDVCISKFQQLERLQNETSSLSTTATKHHRLLKLTLTDGRQVVCGMEYVFLDELDEQVSLGAKVEISLLH
jgi:hypothetical protein